MKKILLLILLAFSLICFSQSDAGVVMRVLDTGGGCGAWSSGGSAHEDFDGADDLTWVDGTSGTGVVDDNESTTPATTCGFDTNWLEIAVDDDADRAYTYTDLGAALTGNCYVRFTLYIVSEDLDDTEDAIILCMRDNGAVGDTDIMLYAQDASGQLQLAYYVGYSKRDTKDISTGQSYCVELFINNTTDNWEWKVTAESGGTYPAPSSEGSGEDNPDESPQRFRFGQYNKEAQGIRFMVDHFDISTTGWLGCDDA